MLTSAAYAERKWGPFPTLRQVLEDKSLKSDESFISVDDRLLDRLARVSNIASLALEHRGLVWDVTRTDGSFEVHTDIDRLIRELQEGISWFTSLSREIQSLHEIVERPERPD